MKGRSPQQLQSQLREQFQSAYKEKIKTMYGMFELKYQTLHDAILSVFERIKKDELLGAMLSDRTTSVHLLQRVREIFAQVVAQQRQFVFKKLGTQIANLKFENEQLVRQMRRLKESSQHLEKDFYTERISFEQAKNNTGEELRRLREENYGLQIERKEWGREGEQLRRKVEELSEENEEMKELLGSLRESKELLEGQGKELNFYKGQIKSLEGEVEELKGAIAQSQAAFERRYQNKKREFKSKIEEYKNVINEMRANRVRTESTVKNEEEVRLGGVYERKLAGVVREGERKLAELRALKERERGELQRKYEYKMKEMNVHLEKMLQGRILEVEESTAGYLEKMKEEGTKMLERIRIYQENYVGVGEFEEEVGKREEVIGMMRRKLEEFQAERQSSVRNEEILLGKLRDAELMASEYKQKAYQLEEVNLQISNKIKSYEQSNNIFKINEKRIKEQFEEYERINKKTKEESEELRRQKINLQQTVGQLQNSLRQRQRKLKEGQQQNEVLQRKARKNVQAIESLTRERETLLFGNNELKKEISNLQYKVKDWQMNVSLVNGSWQGKLNGTQIELKEKGVLLGQLQNKYQQMCQSYQEEKKRNYEIENELRKFEMESKFYKSSGEMHKNEHQIAIQEARRVISEKDKRIQMIQIQNENREKRIRLMESQQSLSNERMYGQNKLLKGKLVQMAKLVEAKLQSMRKESRGIKDYLQSREMILKNDEAVLMSTFYKELLHCSIYYQKEREAVVRKMREEMLGNCSNDVKLVKSEFQDRIRQMNDRNQYEKNALKLQIKDRDDKIQEYSRQLKRSQIEAKKEKQECKNMEKQNQILSMKLQKEKEHLQQRVLQLTKQMRDEKDLILKQYSDRKNEMDHQIAELIATIKRLKTEIELIQSKHEEEKLVIQAQLRTVRQQEEAIQKIAHQKDAEMQRYQKECENAQEIKRNLQNQVRGYAETLNKKIQLIHQLQLKENQTLGDFNLIRTKFDRVSQENSELKRKFSQREEQFEEASRMKVRMEGELREIKGALNRSSKNNELRSLNELSMSTLQLSQKVNEMRKVNNYLDSKTPLRS